MRTAWRCGLALLGLLDLLVWHGRGAEAHEPTEVGRSKEPDSEASHAHGHAEGVETEHIFGFTLGADTHARGETEIEPEVVGRLQKRGGSYRALTQKLEIHTGITGDFDISLNWFGDHHRMRSVVGFDNVPSRNVFDGASAEFRWRLIRRGESGFGLTLVAEPSWGRVDELSGKVGRRLGLENALVLDKELIPDTLFGAINLTYDLGAMKERFAFATERGSTVGVSAALTARVSATTFVGGEVRYLNAYEGLGLRQFAGKALYVGPTLYTNLTPQVWLKAAWNVQVAGREALDRAELAASAAEAIDAGEDPHSVVPIRRSRLDLKNFERHLFQVKMGFPF